MDTSEKNRIGIEEILLLLPQTQCGRCGFDNCRSYAEAIAANKTGINRCPTGGQAGIRMLARLFNIAEPVLDASCGEEKPRAIARIDETRCTGCTLCIQTCPFDAIVGTGKMMHTVISEVCTGCERCVSRCPIDCIDMKIVSGTRTGWNAWSAEQARAARERYERRLHRLQMEKKEETGLADTTAGSNKKTDLLRKALDRARVRLKSSRTS
ncbi:RnfABCDGE type electron transport complex subunit B [Oxalobacter paraformigenes]|uniref:Electron transport complex, rnfabcdge type, B subunit n=1 Tax=Oxalobacter paraformigenes TaxID=556268 RepID=C3X1E3_9BURK|nr:RnfABCDGE type electron transport complex subunit B [Oxalobacter paraformigenes]EEO27029.1 electron transport complex, rnfabcdge type, B subunit [Oxalobacter paraformigenes]